MAFNAQERLNAYSEILSSQEPINPEQVLKLHDMIREDLTAYENADQSIETLRTDNQRLRDTNHELFTRVTGGSTPREVEGPELSGDEQALLSFEELIKEGKL